MTTLRIAGGQVLRPDMTVERADVLVDQDAGEIVAVGADIEGGDDLLDADDGLVIPGLINGHTHVAMTLLRGYADDKPLDAWLQEDIWPVEAELTAEDVRVGAELGIVEMIKSGTTAFSDMYFNVSEIADAVEEAGVRAVLGHTAITVGKDEEGAREDMQSSLDVALELDGAADGRVSTTFQPHSLTTVGEEYLREFVPRAREAGLPMHFHANETEGEVDPIVDDHGERPLAYADDIGLLSPENFLAHGVHVDDEEIDLLADSGTAVIHCPASNMKLASGMAPVQRMLDAGVTVGLGTDGAASNNDLDMFDEIRDAAMIGKLAADDASAVAAADAVELATTGGADALGIDSGRIEPGANADLAVLDLSEPHLTPAHDLVSHLAYAASGSDVRHTICDGDVLMRDREVLTLYEPRVRDAAAEHAEALVERATDE
ncbi:5-methylthioadenosine/S-adenosylhomocysteine deaminase [Natronoarchaeum philippinense]|uniref:5-methylthioadenosine/S-adenosylhomocysteine deaminase n=1 Tax=Natronoarchaeum philippinense TaxID=558529 RepID=A0A285NZB8_NATPI|nr:amidohydrolase [Natronoarchaeum philippinense]SNZ14789.1 5-methylthioadenosine/S-adenosylhomocysteine deaminase [Natronoarchaeum philippinense]